MNKKGFALTETLVVIVFLISIFTFIYVSIIPLLGEYENIINTEKDIDIVYKLYHVRKLIMSDANKDTVTDSEVERIKCSNLNKSTLCSKLMEQMDLRKSSTDNYVIIYAKSLSASNIAAIKVINNEIGEYAAKYKNNIAAEALFLLDTKKHTITHLNYSVAPICKRATVLHTEQCTNDLSSTYYCQGDGYALNSTITYGRLGTKGQMPSVGDAFDCDVNGDGNYTERFYYVSDYYNTNNSVNDLGTYDSNTAVLIYYGDVINGVISTGTEKYHIADNWHGPTSAITQLPTTTQWSNITLKDTSRMIITCTDANCEGTSIITAGGVITPNPFSYAGRAARLLTAQEIAHAGCDTLSGKSSLYIDGSLKQCNFLLERTKYASNSATQYGSWLENPYTIEANVAWYITSYERCLGRSSLNNNYNVTTPRGVRPAIDVPYRLLSY